MLSESKNATVEGNIPFTTTDLLSPAHQMAGTTVDSCKPGIDRVPRRGCIAPPDVRPGIGLAAL